MTEYRVFGANQIGRHDWTMRVVKTEEEAREMFDIFTRCYDRSNITRETSRPFTAEVIASHTMSITEYNNLFADWGFTR